MKKFPWLAVWAIFCALVSIAVGLAVTIVIFHFIQKYW